MLFLPALAAGAAITKSGCRDILIVGLVALAATGACGYSVFWLWFLSPRAGQILALLLPIASAVCLVIVVPRLEKSGRRIIGALLLPILLSGAFSLFVLAAGFVYGGFEMPLIMPLTRFSHQLLLDNAIPFTFAEGIRNHHIAKPMLGDWHSSDRPPLQTGLVLAQGPYNPEPRQLASQVTGVVAQSTWILALWLFLTALEIDSDVIALILVACLSSGFVLVNTFFVWPKLLAAAYTLGALALLLIEKPRILLGKYKSTALLCGALIAFGMLAHGGTVFALLAAAATLIAFRKGIPPRYATILLGTAFLLYLPWLLYQNFYDPPGNRLLKWHLAGVRNVDSRPFTQTLLQAYQNKTASEIAGDKWSNWLAATDQNGEYWMTLGRMIDSSSGHESAQRMKSAARLREIQFFNFIPTLGFVGLGFPMLLLGISKRFRTGDWRLAMRLSLFVLVTIVIWCLLLFGPSAAIIHQGTYVTVLLGFAVCCLALWSASPRLAQAIVALQALLNVLLYTVLMPKPAGGPGYFVNFGTVRFATLLAALASAAAVLWLLYRIVKADAVYKT